MGVSVVLFYSCNLHSPLHNISSPLSSSLISFHLMTVLYYCAVHRSAGGWERVKSHLSNIRENARAPKEVSPFRHWFVKINGTHTNTVRVNGDQCCFVCTEFHYTFSEKRYPFCICTFLIKVCLLCKWYILVSFERVPPQ